MSVLQRATANPGGSITLAATPGAGHKVVLTLGFRFGGNTVNGDVTGGGADWSRIYSHRIGPSTYDQGVEVWVGEGFTGPGPITVSGVSAYMTAFHLDGGSTLTVNRVRDRLPAEPADGTWWDADGARLGPYTPAGAGSVVIGHIGSRWPYPGTVPNVKEPATGWSSVVASPEVSGWQTFWTLYREPSATETHHLETNNANLPASVLQIVVDPPAAPDPPGAPTALAQTAATATSVSVGWGPPASSGAGFTGYELRVNGGAPVATAATAYTVTGLAPSTGYTVEVRATGGPGGPGPWASVVATTLAAADFRTVVRLGGHTWTAEAGDPPELGPVLPVSFGWSVPEDSWGFPAQPDPDTCPLELVTATHADMAGVDIGTTMRVSLYAEGEDRPLATFRGRVADLESAPHPMGLAWRLLGVGYVATELGTNVGAGDWPQESGDARAARIMSEAGKPGFTADAIGATVEARTGAPAPASELLAALSAAAVSTVGGIYGPSRRVLVHPVTDDDGELVPANPFAGTAVVARVDAIDTLDAGLVNRNTSWRRTKLLDATWVRIDHPGGPTVYGDTSGPAYPPVSVSVLDPAELAELILDTTPGYRWLTGQPLRLELWADDGPALAVVRQWFYRDSASHPFPWSGRAVIVENIAQAPDGSTRYAGMLAAATIRLEHVPGAGGRLVVEFRLRPEVPAESTVTVRWMDEDPALTWTDEPAPYDGADWFTLRTVPRP